MPMPRAVQAARAFFDFSVRPRHGLCSLLAFFGPTGVTGKDH
jgi:hypothetical protein